MSYRLQCSSDFDSPPNEGVSMLDAFTGGFWNRGIPEQGGGGAEQRGMQINSKTMKIYNELLKQLSGENWLVERRVHSLDPIKIYETSVLQNTIPFRNFLHSKHRDSFFCSQVAAGFSSLEYP